MNAPLVSVGILTYNSEKYILDALESVKCQTYSNIELIVSDDGSVDNTLTICKNWIEVNKENFKGAKLLSVEKNTGTSANFNRIINSAKGDWLKVFAGDDALCPSCIEHFVLFTNNNPNAKWIVGKFNEYKDTFDEKNKVSFHDSYNSSNSLSLSAEGQFKIMLSGNSFVFSPAVFFNVEMLRCIGGCNEKYGLLEDFPLYLKLLKAGFRCYEMDIIVVKYRTSDSNVWGNMNVLFNFKHKKMDYYVRKDMCFPYYSIREKIRTTCDYYYCSIMNFFSLTTNTIVNRRILGLLQLGGAIITFDFPIIQGFLISIKNRIISVFTYGVK